MTALWLRVLYMYNTVFYGASEFNADISKWRTDELTSLFASRLYLHPVNLRFLYFFNPICWRCAFFFPILFALSYLLVQHFILLLPSMPIFRSGQLLRLPRCKQVRPLHCSAQHFSLTEFCRLKLLLFFSPFFTYLTSWLIFLFWVTTEIFYSVLWS